MTGATHVLWKKLWLRAFQEQVDPQVLSLESVDYFGTSEYLSVQEKEES